MTDLELAWRLAFFLWSEGPDDALLSLAETKKLHEPKVYEQQVRRMLADRRSESLVTSFAFQWLGVRRLDAMDPDPRLFPTFDAELRDAFRTEMRLFLDSILRDERASVLDLYSADYTFVNERLARHYGIADVRGAQFRRVHLDDPRRRGLLGKGSVLLVSSYPDRTSPVLRGAWIMEQIVGTPPQPPPPGVETNLPALDTGVALSVRDRLARHRTKPSCNQCHGVIDPLGQALENFDVTGEWREIERQNGARIDSTGQLAGGGRVQRPRGFAQRAAEGPRPPRAGGRREAHDLRARARRSRTTDMPVVRGIVRDAKAQGWRFSAIVTGVARSAPFTMRERAGSRLGRWRRRGRGRKMSARTHPMFITKKYLSRRTMLKASGVAIGLPLLDAMIPAATALAATAAAPKPRMGFFYLPHGAIMNNTSHGEAMNRWTPSTTGTRLRLEADPRAVHAGQEVPDRRQRARQQARRELRGARDRARDLALVRASAPEPRAVRRRHDRPDRGEAHRPGHAAAVVRGRDRGRRRRRRVRRHVRLQLRPHDLVPHADHAAADGVRPEEGVREDLRARQ